MKHKKKAGIAARGLCLLLCACLCTGSVCLPAAADGDRTPDDLLSAALGGAASVAAETVTTDGETESGTGSGTAAGGAGTITPAPQGNGPDASPPDEVFTPEAVVLPDVPEGLTPVTPPEAFDCKGALLMEAATGAVLYAQNADEALPPASVTKIMTLLLVMEAIDAGSLRWDDEVTASAHAASMGGSQIYLKEGERMSVRDMVKSVVIASANDAACALAEAVAGSEAAFVARMNARAAELGMTHAHFENTNGLDDTALHHVLSARDVALMSRALIAHREILEFSSTWMDTVRGGAFGLTNTNRLVRFYRGCNGLKTGSTAKAGFCVSVTAERDGMTLVAVIMGAPSRDVRNAAAAALLDWGFSSYGLYTSEAGGCDPVRVTGGVRDGVQTAHGALTCVLPRADLHAVTTSVTCPDSVPAPVRPGDEIGRVTVSVRDVVIAELPVRAVSASDKIGFGDVLLRLLARFLLM